MPDLAPLHAMFLLVMLVLVPLAAFRSVKRIRPQPAAPGATPPPRASRRQILLSMLFSLAVMFALSFLVAGTMGADLFWSPPLGARELAAGAVTLLAMFGAMLAARRLRTEEQRRTMGINAWMPRTRGDWSLYIATTVFAGIAEESAYRGVLVWLLVPMVGLYGAALLSAFVFALAHVVQGWQSMLTIFAIALLLQGLVEFTGTLVIAMVAHTTYDIVAGRIASRRFQRLEAEDAAAAAAVAND